MQFNNANFGDHRDSFIYSPFLTTFRGVHSIPPAGAFHLLDDNGEALLDDSDDFLITP